MSPAEQRAYSTGLRLLRLMGLACPAHIERTQPIEEFEEFESPEPRREPMPLTCARGHENCATPGECRIDYRYNRIAAEFAQGEPEDERARRRAPMPMRGAR